MSVPAVVFSLGFEYDWQIGGYDYLEYMSRPEAFDKTLHLQDEYKDFLDYMSNSEKSDGLFDNNKNFLNRQDKEQYRKFEEVSRSEGCPKYFGVISFDNSFLEEHGILNNGVLKNTDLKELGRTAINELISKSRKLDATNVYWNAAIHTNTDNIHIHYSICEYHRLENRLKTRRDKDLIEVEAFDALKSKVINKLVGNEFSKEITELVRTALLPEMSGRLINCSEQLLSLRRTLPPDASQYNRKSMERYRTAIDKTTDSVINSDAHLLGIYNSFISRLDEQTEKLKDLYGPGKRNLYLNYKKNKLQDFYSRAGNIILKHLSPEQCATVAHSQKTATGGLFQAHPTSEKKTARRPLVFDELIFEEQFKKKEKRYSQLNQSDNPYSAYSLGKLYLGDEKYNLDKAVTYLEKAVESDSTRPYAAYTLARTLLSNNKYHNSKRAISLLESASEQNSQASYLLGKLYLYGTDDITKDKAKALGWLRKSAEQGNQAAASVLSRASSPRPQPNSKQQPDRKIIKRLKSYGGTTINAELLSAMSMLRRIQFDMETHLQQLKNEYNRDFDYQLYVSQNSMSY